MDLSRFSRRFRLEWEIAPHGGMRVPAVIYASEALIRDMDEKVYEQAVNVATLPGIVKASYAMPDAHWGYGFPIGGVAAFDPDEGGVVSAGGVGFDISCGVRCLHTGLARADIERVQKQLADVLFRAHPGRRRQHRARSVSAPSEMDDMLRGGARWAVEQGYGERRRSRAHRGARADGGARARQRLRSTRRSGSATRWARSARATTTSRCRTSTRGLRRGDRRGLRAARRATSSS